MELSEGEGDIWGLGVRPREEMRSAGWAEGGARGPLLEGEVFRLLWSRWGSPRGEGDGRGSRVRMREEIWDPAPGRGRKLEFPGGKGGCLGFPCQSGGDWGHCQAEGADRGPLRENGVFEVSWSGCGR